MPDVKLTNQSITFGWGAEPFASQLPDLPPAKALAFDEDNKSIIRLHLRGFITDSQRDQAIRKVTREIARTLTPAGRTALGDG